MFFNYFNLNQISCKTHLDHGNNIIKIIRCRFSDVYGNHFDFTLIIYQLNIKILLIFEVKRNYRNF